MGESVMTRFSPFEHGFHFSNSSSFVNTRLHWPDGTPLEVNGKCVGMSLAALDYFQARKNVPPYVSGSFAPSRAPADDSALGEFLERRHFSFVDFRQGLFHLFGSLPLPGRHGSVGVACFFERELETLKDHIRNDRPVPLLLIDQFPAVWTTRDSPVGVDHMVVAYGYETDGDRVNLFVYDCNMPDNDRVVISVIPSDGHFTESNFAGANLETWKAIFCVPYDAEDPPEGEEVRAVEGITLNPDPAYVGEGLTVRFVVRNRCEYRVWLDGLRLSATVPGGGDLPELTAEDPAGGFLLPDATRELVRTTTRFGAGSGQYGLTASYRVGDPARGVWYKLGVEAGATNPRTFTSHRRYARLSAPNILDFGDKPPGAPLVTGVINLRSIGELPLVVDRIEIEPSSDREFKLVGVPALPVTVNPGASLPVSVSFMCPLTFGTVLDLARIHFGKVLVGSNANGGSIRGILLREGPHLPLVVGPLSTDDLKIRLRGEMIRTLEELELRQRRAVEPARR